VRIAELSRLSGVPVGTIKYYVREGLISPGELTSPNQAQYDDGHLRRLKLVRALVDVGELSIAETRDVLASIDSPGKTLHETLGKAHRAVTPSLPREVDEESWAAASRQVEELVRRRGWQVEADTPAWKLLTQVLATIHALGQEDLAALVDDYADAAERLAEAEVGCILKRPDVESMIEGMVIGVVLGDTLLAALRRLAQADASCRIAAEQTKPAGGRASPARSAGRI
jgi:DNA-binding transcriptional MerR regulator